MQAYQLPDGRLLVPRRAQGPGLLGDGADVIGPDDPEHAQWLRWYEGHGERIPPAPPGEAEEQAP